MRLTKLSMRLQNTADSSILTIGEFVLDQQLVIKEVCLCQNKYGNYFLRFPENLGQRLVHPINCDFYQEMLAAALADYYQKRSILGRKKHETKDG